MSLQFFTRDSIQRYLSRF